MITMQDISLAIKSRIQAESEVLECARSGCNVFIRDERIADDFQYTGFYLYHNEDKVKIDILEDMMTLPKSAEMFYYRYVHNWLYKIHPNQELMI